MLKSKVHLSSFAFFEATARRLHPTAQPQNGPYLQLLPPRQNAPYDARFGPPTIPNASKTCTCATIAP